MTLIRNVTPEQVMCSESKKTIAETSGETCSRQPLNANQSNKPTQSSAASRHRNQRSVKQSLRPVRYVGLGLVPDSLVVHHDVSRFDGESDKAGDLRGVARSDAESLPKG